MEFYAAAVGLLSAFVVALAVTVRARGVPVPQRGYLVLAFAITLSADLALAVGLLMALASATPVPAWLGEVPGAALMYLVGIVNAGVLIYGVKVQRAR